jgi:hypothetical protein
VFFKNLAKLVTGNMYSYISPKLEARPRKKKGGFGVFADLPVEQGELLVVWGGEVINAEELQRLPAITQRHSIQVEENLYLAPVAPAEPADFVNHCCNPNAGMSGQIALVAMREIKVGEEVCYDYAMSDGSPYDEFECACGTPDCRAGSPETIGAIRNSGNAIPDIFLPTSSAGSIACVAKVPVSP